MPSSGVPAGTDDTTDGVVVVVLFVVAAAAAVLLPLLRRSEEVERKRRRDGHEMDDDDAVEEDADKDEDETEDGKELGRSGDAASRRRSILEKISWDRTQIVFFLRMGKKVRLPGHTKGGAAILWKYHRHQNN